MIVAVTLNPALDVTYEVGVLIPRTSHQVRHILRRAGGKGVNVARVAAACGAEVTATGLAGGPHGVHLGAELGSLGIRAEFVPIAADTRQTITVVPDGAADPTEFREPGPRVSDAEWERFTGRYAALVTDAAVVTLSGSLPPGVPASAYATLTTIARNAGATVIVDAGGAALRLACQAGPDIVKPNAAELLTALTADSPQGAADGAATPSGARSASRVAEGAAGLRAAGAGAVVTTLGRTGSVAVTGAGCWRITHDRLDGNPVGAGDSLVAGLALAADRTRTSSWDAAGWRRALAEATGLAMATVVRPAAGEADLAAARGFAQAVRIRAIGGR